MRPCMFVNIYARWLHDLEYVGAIERAYISKKFGCRENPVVHRDVPPGALRVAQWPMGPVTAVGFCPMVDCTGKCSWNAYGLFGFPGYVAGWVGKGDALSLYAPLLAALVVGVFSSMVTKVGFGARIRAPG